MPSLYDPQTYLRGIKGAKSILNKIRDYSTEPEVRTGALKRIKSEVETRAPKMSTEPMTRLPRTKEPEEVFDFGRVQSKKDQVQIGEPSGVMDRMRTDFAKDIQIYGTIPQRVYWKPPKELDKSKIDQRFLDLPISQQEKDLKFFGEKAKYMDQLSEIYAKQFNKRKNEISKEKKEIEKGYKEPGFFGQLMEGIKQSAIQQMANLALTVGAKYKGVEPIEKVANKAANHFEKKLLQNPEWNAPEDMGRFDDPDFYARGIASGLTSVMGSILVGVLTAPTGPGSPYSVYKYNKGIVMGGELRELLDAGVDYNEAVWLANYSSSLQGLLEYTPIGRILRRIKGGKELVGSFVKNLVKSGGKQMLAEGSTEGLQQLISNEMMSTYLDDRETWDGVLEEAFFGGIVGGGVDVTVSVAQSELVRDSVTKLREDTRGELGLFIGEEAERGKILPQKTPEMVEREGITPRTLPDTIPTTKIIEKLKGMDKVSKQFIQDLIKMPAIKQGERQAIQNILNEYDEGKINVKEFQEKVRMELIPLSEDKSPLQDYGDKVLPPDKIGKVDKYEEIIYQSPIETKAGQRHFHTLDSSFQNYFAHTRRENVGDVRRVIEIQSDLFQGRFKREYGPQDLQGQIDAIKSGRKADTGQLRDLEQQLEEQKARAIELIPLAPYKNIWFERIVREEVKSAVDNDFNKIQFPVGETAMSIEGLGGLTWEMYDYTKDIKTGSLIYEAVPLTADNILPGSRIYNSEEGDYIVIEDKGDGQVGAVPRYAFDELVEEYGYTIIDKEQQYPNKKMVEEIKKNDLLWDKVQVFNAEIKTDQKHPIYKLYEKEIGKYLKKEYGDNVKRVTDKRGVEWWELNVSPKLREDVRKRPVFAFKKTPQEGVPERARAKAEQKPSQQPERKITDDIRTKIEKAAKRNPYARERMEEEYKNTGEVKGAGIAFKPTAHQLLVRQANKRLRAELLRNQVEVFTKEDLKLFDKARRLMDTKKFASGDIERLRKAYPQLVQDMIDRYNAATKSELYDTEAFEEIMDLPSQKEMTEAEKGMTLEERKIMREGLIQTEKDIMNRRRIEIRAIKKFLNLTDAEIMKISKRDLRLMDDEEFSEFIAQMRVEAIKLAETKEAKAILMNFIRKMDFKKWESLREALQLPTINKMTTKQLDDFLTELQPYQYGDVFLTKRKLETVDRTDLKGIKTIREARERLAEEIGVKVTDLEAIKFEDIDRMKFDTALAEKNPFYKMMVDEINQKVLEADKAFLEDKKEFLELYDKAIKSRKKPFKEKAIQAIVPQQKQIVEYLEAPIDKKPELAAKLTKEELDVAFYMMEHYKAVMDYHVAIESELGTRFGNDDYYTHIRRGILESVKEDGIIKAFKGVFDSYRQDASTFNILDEDTGKILPLEKFFQFSLRRSEELGPTYNISKSFLSYMKTFRKKQMFDRVIPKLDIYAHSFESQRFTPTGLELDRSAIKFVREWINNKKGRRTKLLAKQGSKLDLTLRALKTFVSVKQLGFSLALGVATQVGEQVTTYETLGMKAYAKGKARQLTNQGKKILKKYENFIGESPWAEIIEPGKGGGERLMEGLFIFFRDASVRANKTMLLGSMTEQEFIKGEISTKRLAELKRIMGRWRALEGSKSIIGSTPEAGIATQYLGWAIPVARTIAQDTTALSRSILRLGSKEQRLTKNQAMELLRIVQVGGLLSVVMLLSDDEDDRSFLGELKRKAKRELGTLFQAVTPDTWVRVPPSIQFLINVNNHLMSLIKLEEYSTSGYWGKKGDLKGVRGLKKEFIPKLVSQFISEHVEEPELKERIKAQSEEREEMKKGAESLYLDLKSLPRKEANERAREIKKTDPELYKKLKAVIEKKKLDLTDKDKLIKQLGVKNGERASYILEQAESMNDPKEKNAYINELKTKKIISNEVWKQMKDIKEKGGTERKQSKKEKYLEERGALGLVSDYIKGFVADPANAWKALATKERLGIVEGNLVELQRFYGIKYTDKGGSQEYKKKRMEEMGIPWSEAEKYKLEHILPVGAGGDTSDENLLPVTNEQHNLFTPIDIALGLAVRNEEITRKRAKKLAEDFKINKTITAEDLMEALD